MNLRISDPKIEQLAQELANRTGETLADAVTKALEERLARGNTDMKKNLPPVEGNQRREEDIEARTAAIMEIVQRVKKLPVLDDRTPEEMLYDDDGLPI